ncbi:MAG: dihydrofolate synthase [Gaiellales bacterium]
MHSSSRGAAAARTALDALERFGIRLDLDRMRALMRALGDPQAELAAVHIVGTNGKSSTTRMCAAALTASGLHVGTYLSPHIVGLEERVQIDGAALSAERFDRIVVRVLDAADAVADELGEGPTQFEALTAVAFVAFAEEGLDAVCVEAGLGGRLDATNVLDARVVGLTNVGLDHTAVLGDTPLAIMGEKIAVVSPGAVVVLGELSDELAATATADALARGAREVRRVPADDLAAAAGLLAAGYQRPNAALALACARAFLEPVELDVAAVREAIAAAAPPGRLELRPGAPLELRDGAHNPHGMRALVAELDSVLGDRRPRVALVALQADKDGAGILELLAPHVDRVVATSSGHTGALAPAAVASLARAAGVEADEIDDPAAARVAARASAGPDGAVVICGTLYLLSRLAALEAAR